MIQKPTNLTCNRRQWQRVTEQLPVSYDCARGEAQGVTLNISERGARVVLRHAVAKTFSLTLKLDEPVQVEAETVWEQTLLGGSRILGVRFKADHENQARLKAWLGQRLSV